jgi:DNA helicase-2/ATP-dependent DNA helicase PcrA
MEPEPEAPASPYQGLDPDYWKASLRPNAAPPQRAAGRQVVYDEPGAERDTSGIVPGMRVHHQAFGTGKVLDIEGVGERAAATVFFKSVGQKKLKLKFARLTVVEG